MSPARQPAAAARVCCARRPPPESRDDSGVLLGMAILAMVILTIASTGVVLIVAADWRTTLNRDSGAEAAAAAVSAEYLIDGLITAVGPKTARDTLYPLDPLNPPTGRKAEWRPIAGETTPRACLAEGCWTVTFSCAVADARLLGLQAASTSATDCDNLVHGSEIPVWTVTITAAAHCDPYPIDATLTAARDACQAVAPLVELVYEPVSLPLYSTVLGDGLIAADRDRLDPVYDAVASQLGADWVAVTSVLDAAGHPANDPIAISSTQTGLFINTADGNVCETRFASRQATAAAQNIATAAGGAGCDAAAGAAIGAGTGALELHNITGEPLSVELLKGEACEASPPAVIPDVVEWAVASLPATLPPGNRMGVQVVHGDIGASDPAVSGYDELHTILAAPDAPRAIIATGSVYIHQNIAGDLTTGGVVLIISGCHVFVVPPLAGTDTRTLANVAIIAAGGLWASDLTPPVNYVTAYNSGTLDLPSLHIAGSVVTGWAGQVTLTGHVAGAEIGIAGFVPCFFDTAGNASCEDRTVPAGWAGAVTQFWPGREYGSWRQR